VGVGGGERAEFASIQSGARALGVLSRRYGMRVATDAALCTCSKYARQCRKHHCSR